MGNLPVMPIGRIQSTDIRNEHKLGYFRICASYKDPNNTKGFDQFPKFAAKLFGNDAEFWNYHLIVQLKGCPLKCPYCYVDDEGINGLNPIQFTPNELINKSKEFLYADTRLNVFHLMGGTPGLYIKYWSDILKAMKELDLNSYLFHSDLILIEPDIIPDFYNHLIRIKKYKNHLIALCVKGITDKNLFENTGVSYIRFNKYSNNLIDIISTGINFYITLINPDNTELPNFLDSLTNYMGIGILDKIQLLQIKQYNVTKLRFKNLYNDINEKIKSLNENFELSYQILNSYVKNNKVINSNCLE